MTEPESHDAFLARMRADDDALVARLEARRAAMVAEIEAATATLRDLNRRTFRDALRGVFERHPALETLGVNQHASYNDQWYPLYVDGLWVNGRFVNLYDTVYERGPLDGIHEGMPPELPEPGIELGTQKEQDARMVRNERHYFSRDEVARVQAELRDEYGPLYAAAVDAARTLRSLGTQYGPHFFADAFGFGVTIEATRTELRLTPVYVHDGSQYEATAERERWLLMDRGVHLGSVFTGYAADPERAPHVALRLARDPDLDALERWLLQQRLTREARTLGVPGALYGFGWHADAFGTLTHLCVGPFRVELGYDLRLTPEALSAPHASSPVTLVPSGYVRHYDAPVEQAVAAWHQAVAAAREQYGHMRFGALVRAHPPGDRTF